MDKIAFLEETYNKAFNDEIDKIAGMSDIIRPMFKKYQQFNNMTSPGAVRMAEKITDPALRSSRLAVEKANLKSRLNYSNRYVK